MKRIDFENGTITSNILQTALPIIAAQMLNLLYSIVDRIYIGRLPGEGAAALSGIGLCFPVVILITAFTNLYSQGGAPLCAMELGRRNPDHAEKLMNVSGSLLLYTAIVLTIICEAAGKSVLIAFGADALTLPYALGYLRIYLLGTIFVMFAGGLNPFINAQGFSLIGMMTVAIGAASNIILDPIFIFVLKMGVRGAALATVLSQILSAFAAAGFLAGGKAYLKLGLMRPAALLREKKRIVSIVTLGLASFIMQITNSLVMIFCNRILARLGGSGYVAVMTLVSSVRQIVDTPVLALSDGASPIISYNFGGMRAGRLRKTVRITTVLALGYTFIIWLLIMLAPTFLIRIFNDDKELALAAVPAMRIYFFAFVFQALQYSGQTYFKATGKRTQAIFFSLLRKAVLVIPLTLILPYRLGMGTDGVFAAEPISNVIGGLACFITMRITLNRELRNENES